MNYVIFSLAFPFFLLQSFQKLVGLKKVGLSAIFFLISFPHRKVQGKIKKDAASIPNAVAKGTPKTIPKKVLLVNLSCVIFITLFTILVIKVYL